jgi:hypothetical protein
MVDKKLSRRVADVFRTLTKPVRSNDTSVIEIMPLIQEYAVLPFILSKESGIPPSHGRARLIELAMWLCPGSMFCMPNLAAHEAFASVGISQKDVKNRMAPVLHLVLRDELEDERVYRLLDHVAWRAKGFRTLRMDGRGKGMRFSWTPRERYVRFETV